MNTNDNTKIYSEGDLIIFIKKINKYSNFNFETKGESVLCYPNPLIYDPKVLIKKKSL